MMTDEERAQLRAALRADDGGVALRALIDARIVAAIKATPEWQTYAAEMQAEEDAILYGTGVDAATRQLLNRAGIMAHLDPTDKA